MPTAANMVRDLSSTRSQTAFSAGCSQHGPRPLKRPVRDRFSCLLHGPRPPQHPVRPLYCPLQPTWSETSLVSGPRPLLLPTADNMVRDLSSTRSETAFSAYFSQHGPRPPKHPDRDGFYCRLQPTWFETSQVPGPRPLLVRTAANMVRDLFSTRSETAFSAYCSQHGPRHLKYPVRDPLLVPAAANMVRDILSTRSARPLFVPTAANMVRDLSSTRSETRF